MVWKSWQSVGFAADQTVNNHTFDYVLIYSLFLGISIIMNYKRNTLGKTFYFYKWNACNTSLDGKKTKTKNPRTQQSQRHKVRLNIKFSRFFPQGK